MRSMVALCTLSVLNLLTSTSSLNQFACESFHPIACPLGRQFTRTHLGSKMPDLDVSQTKRLR